MKAVFALAIVAALVALSFQQSTTPIESKTTEPKADPKVESTTPSSGSTTTVVTPTSSLKPDQKSGKLIGFNCFYIVILSVFI